MIRETIGEPHTVPVEGKGGEKNLKVSSIQHRLPEERDNDKK
jgi:hypothetical protein